jgi:hypothetical protein
MLTPMGKSAASRRITDARSSASSRSSAVPEGAGAVSFRFDAVESSSDEVALSPWFCGCDVFVAILLASS